MKAMRREIEGTDVAVAPVVSEGGRGTVAASVEIGLRRSPAI